jgi:hypothetical protein
MTYTVTKLITGAFYLSGVVSKEFQSVTGDQLGEGLEFLNDILGDVRINNDMVPYYSSQELIVAPGESVQFIPGLIQAETLTFFIQSIRYQMAPVGRDAFFGNSRAENITSLPLTYHVERAKGGANIYFYFKPNQEYAMQLWGQFGLEEATGNEDLSIIYDRFYINYLKYAVTSRICQEYGYSIPMEVSKQLEKYIDSISKKSAVLDLTNTITSTLGGGGALNYAQVNLGHGWVTSG